MKHFVESGVFRTPVNWTIRSTRKSLVKRIVDFTRYYHVVSDLRDNVNYLYQKNARNSSGWLGGTVLLQTKKWSSLNSYVGI